MEKDDVTQSSILMGHLGILMNDPDYYALEVMNQALSGSFASRLFSNVRTKKGLAYAVFGGVNGDWDHPGLAMLFASTKTETTGAGIDALLEEASNLTAQPLTAAEVETAKQGLLSSFIFRFDTPREVLDRQLYLEIYGYPLDWLSRYRAGIEAVTLEQVRKPRPATCGPRSSRSSWSVPRRGMDKPLATCGKVTPIDVTLPEPPPQGGRQ